MNFCWIGGARYAKPLDLTNEKKFRALNDLGKLYVISFSKSLRPHIFSQYARFYLLPELPHSILRYVEMFTIGVVLTLWVILKHQVRILVAQSPYEGFTAALAKCASRLFGIRVALIIESHGDFEESLFLQRSVLLPMVYRRAMTQMATFSLRHADFLRAVSSSTRQQLESWNAEKPIVQFPAWTDLEVFLEASKEKPKKPPCEIIYVGILIPRKGVHFLINSFALVSKEFPECRLFIIGKAENYEYRTKIQAQVTDLALSDRVVFIDELSQKDLACHMARAQVLVLPSVSEGLGRVVVEAMATKTPVIGSRVGGIPDMIQDQVTGFLVPPGDEEALAQRLRWVLTNSKEAREMGHRACEFAKTFISTEAYVQGYHQVFKAARDLLVT